MNRSDVGLEGKRDFDCDDIQKIVDEYNNRYSRGMSNYLAFSRNPEGDKCRVYLTGKYDSLRTYGIGTTQKNVVRTVDTMCLDDRSPACYFEPDLFARKFLGGSGEFYDGYIKSLFDDSEKYPSEFKEICNCVDPKKVSRQDWKCKYHFPNYW